MELVLMLGSRVLLLNAFGWIWHYANSPNPPAQFSISRAAWSTSAVATLLWYAVSLGAFEMTAGEQ